MTLESLGLVINLGHPTDICPVAPDIRRIFVIDLSGYHFVCVRFCACSRSSFLEPYRQLLRFGWFPASQLRPKTAFTFDLLDTYHKISLQGKLNLYDFYTSTMQKTDNCGRSKTKVCRFFGALMMRLTFVCSTGITRYHGASVNGAILRTSNGVQPATPPQVLMISVMGLSQLSVLPVHIQVGIYLRVGRMQPRTKCMSFHHFLYCSTR